MKKSTLQKIFTLLMFALLFSPITQAQTCVGDVFLSSQAVVDAFNCSFLSGNLEIGGADITNLDALSTLTYIVGDVSILGNPLLTNVNGFSNVGGIEGELIISGNAALANVDGFSNVPYINGTFQIILNILLMSTTNH